MSNGFAEAYKLDVNLEFIKKKSGFNTDKELANALGVSQAQINAVKQNGKIPGVDPFLMNLSRLSGYTINDLLLEDLEDREMTIVARAAVSMDEHRKLIGLYYLYYFGTSSFKGRETSTDAAALEFGLLAVYMDSADGMVHCRADFGLTRDEADERYDACHELFNGHSILKKGFHSILINKYQDDLFYEGTINMTHGHIFFQCAAGAKDNLSMILHRPDSRAPRYIGGIAAALSISKGREASPCMQIVGMSKYKITTSEEEIARHLLLGYPSIDPGPEFDHVLSYIADAVQYHNEQTPVETHNMSADLADRNTRFVISANLMTIITRIVIQNLFRVIKISTRDDDDWYHFCKLFINDAQKK